MIKAKAELFVGGASVQLSLKGTTKDLLLELKALCVGALSSMEFPKIDRREATLDERIEILCELLCEEDEDDGEQED